MGGRYLDTVLARCECFWKWCVTLLDTFQRFVVAVSDFLPLPAISQRLLYFAHCPFVTGMGRPHQEAVLVERWINSGPQPKEGHWMEAMPPLRVEQAAQTRCAFI